MSNGGEQENCTKAEHGHLETVFSRSTASKAVAWSACCLSISWHFSTHYINRNFACPALANNPIFQSGFKWEKWIFYVGKCGSKPSLQTQLNMHWHCWMNVRDGKRCDSVRLIRQHLQPAASLTKLSTTNMCNYISTHDSKKTQQTTDWMTDCMFI